MQLEAEVARLTAENLLLREQLSKVQTEKQELERQLEAVATPPHKFETRIDVREMMQPYGLIYPASWGARCIDCSEGTTTFFTAHFEAVRENGQAFLTGPSMGFRTSGDQLWGISGFQAAGDMENRYVRFRFTIVYWFDDGRSGTIGPIEVVPTPGTYDDVWKPWD